MLYFVEYVLLGNKGKNLINLQWIQLVDSLKEFNKYLWEKICYERTLIGLQKNVKICGEKKKKKGMQSMKHMPFKFGLMKSFHYLE